VHVAARRWDVAMMAALVEHGADPLRRRADGSTPHTLAELHGNNVRVRIIGARTGLDNEILRLLEEAELRNAHPELAFRAHEKRSDTLRRLANKRVFFWYDR